LEFASERGQAQWRRYYQPEAAAHPSWSGAPPTPTAKARLRAAGPGACTTSVDDAARAVTATKVSRRAGRDARAGGLGAAAVARLAGGWPLRAASIGCVALAAAGLAAGRRRPPRPAPPVATRRAAPTEAGIEVARPPRHALRPPRPKPEPPAPSPTVVEAALCPVPAPTPVSLLVDARAAPPPASRRAKPHAPSAPPLPNIDSAGIGIPTE
ncbi:MAG: hypothetical protein ABUS79_26290, partial [Pseudomonadota bacterium]